MFKTIRTKIRFIPLVLGLTLLSACRTSVDNNTPTIDSERDTNTEKKKAIIKEKNKKIPKKFNFWSLFIYFDH